MLTRRHFLRNTFSTALGLSALNSTSLLTSSILSSAKLRTRPDGYKTIVCVNLNGGNDSFNMLTPYSQAEYNAYQSARSNIAIERSRLLAITPQSYPADSFGINPNMPGVRDMFNNGDLSFIANVGSLVQPVTKAEILDRDSGIALPSLLGSHNTQTFYWQADHDNSLDSTQDGWGGRLANEFIPEGFLPSNIAIGGGYQLFHAHKLQKFYNVNLSGLITPRDFMLGNNNSASLARRKAIEELNILAKNSSNPFLQYSGGVAVDGYSLSQTLQNILTNIPDLSDRFPASSGNGGAFASAFARAAEITLARSELGMPRQILYLEQAGFDTHGTQATRHEKLMTDLSNNLTVFNEIMRENNIHDSVITMTTSEFGRTLSSNGDGTDHGWGSSHIVMGGAIDGGRIIGDFPELALGSDDDLNDAGRIIPSQSISQYVSTIAKWFGVPDNNLVNVFPNLENFSVNDLGFIK